ncbi:MAG: DUF3341 domain-containing protein [Planctomycetota bacterium]
MERTLPLYGMLAGFEDPDALLEAAHKTTREGYTVVEAYSPMPIHGLAEAIGFESTRLPWIVLLGGILGGLTGYLMQYYSAVIDYPYSVGGKPDHSWPQFVPITFEMTILGAGLSAVLGMLALNGLPRPNHPVFNVPDFKLASRDGFFLFILARDPKFEEDSARVFLESLTPIFVAPVEEEHA